MIKGINILEQTPIKENTTLFTILMVAGIGVAIIATILFFVRTKSKNSISFKDTITKIFFFLYVLGRGTALLSIIRIPWFYAETGRYTYKCTFDSDVRANDIGNNFNIISVEDEVWIIEDK